jgi:adenine-specific DNA-methyltransferase
MGRNDLQDKVETRLSALSGLTDANHYFINSANELVINQIDDYSLDLVLTSPPYNIGKSYERVQPLASYLEAQDYVIGALANKITEHGNIAWQVGFTLDKGELVPLDAILYPLFKKHGFKLRNRVVWTFGHGMHAKKKFSGRHETVMVFSKAGPAGYFDLDSVRVPQKYPEKRSYKGPNKGNLSGNPLGKNPGDVWDIPNVKAHHVEKTLHDCQFPIALAQRLIRSLSPIAGVVFDPYAGVGSTNCAAVLEDRRSVGAEMDRKFFQMGLERLQSAIDGTLAYRPLSKPIATPNDRRGVHDEKN